MEKIKPTHKHTHLQVARGNRTNQNLQKSVLANAQPTDKKMTERGAADNMGSCCTTILKI